MKDTAIEEAKDVFGSLRTFELSFENQGQQKRGGVAFEGMYTNLQSGTLEESVDNEPKFSPSDFEELTGGVTFGDSMKGNVVGKENIYLPGAPKLNNVCLVEGISIELNNISQLGDQGFRRLSSLERNQICSRPLWPCVYNFKERKNIMCVGTIPIKYRQEEHSTSSLTEASSNKDASTQLFAHSMHMKKKHLVSNVIGDISSGINMRKKNRLDYAKMIVDHRLANESIIFDQHHSCASVIDLISKVGMMCTVTNLAKFYLKLVREFIVNLLANFNDPVTPYIKKLVLEHFGGMVRTWPTDCQFPTMKLSVKYAILQKFGIANWFSSTHMASKLTALAELIYHIGTGALVDVSQHPKVITNDKMMGPAPKSFTLSYIFFQGSHVPDLPATFQPPRWASSSSNADLSIPLAGLHLSKELAMRVVQLLSEESRLLSVSL
ncbi:uncharacterized protein E6C27_scaffold35G00350 [Cucumis melo var. makuwa]|uniref:Uncharacterized protein n=1 Tax=Cucumis melo var. makuwa TaxID=1194695 RepID=A0A5A7TG72_CUCMM|nr:uncharacterized protein E6C27_scaffold35G00350 [Cucumis melo var. makuwa]